MSEKQIIELAKRALEDEVFSAYIYDRLSRIYRNGAVVSKFVKAAEMEAKHAEFWKEFLKKRGYDYLVKPGRLKLLLFTCIFRVLGLVLTLRILEMSERSAAELYGRMIDSGGLSDKEKSMLKNIMEDEMVHEHEFTEEESRFKEFMSHIKDAVLGMNDGLVEILSVTTGLAGAYGSLFHVALGGLVVGAAGALSMGIGAFTGARAQRQVHEGILTRIELASRYVAHLLREKVKSYMTKKGYSERVSEIIAEESSRNKGLLSSVIAEEEYGIREAALENPLKTGLYTGVAYLFGAFIPLIPYFLHIPLTLALITSLILAAASLALTGSIIAISANLPIKRKILEMVIAGLGSAALTFLIGKAASLILGIKIE